jgi:3-deoxy-D-manno-octulosonic-acid transferase
MLMRYVLDVTYSLLLFLLAPFLVYKALTTGKYRRGLLAKFLGNASLRPGNSKCCWFHGVSVGEIHLLRQVVARFRQCHPKCTCVISTTTDTGFEEARKAFPELAVFYWPLDFSWAVARALDRVRPSLVVLAEGEIWPNFVIAAASRAIPVAVINARMSPRSRARYLRFSWLLAPVLSKISLLCAQTAEYAAAFIDLGIDPKRIHVTGSVKYDGVAGDRNAPRTRELVELLGLNGDQTIWIAGSTQAPEEEIVLNIHRLLRQTHPLLRLVIVPRQRERFGEVGLLLERAEMPYVRRSELKSPLPSTDCVVLLDTIGELGALWGAADIAFVGGSLDGRRGGQNMIEPAAYGAAVIFGPHVWNFKETAARLEAARAAIRVADADELESTVYRLLENPEERHRLGDAAREFVRSQQGATEKTISLLATFVGEHSSQGQAA